eukprot:11649553-Alexandrium_andersonii.AAC.1
MSASLVGSEMCIRDSHLTPGERQREVRANRRMIPPIRFSETENRTRGTCLLYTSDAADDM